jgi:amidophosphoribosyltransferase
MGGEVRDECGLAAVYLKKPKMFPTGGAAAILYQMLLQQQNRGQLSAGITTYNPLRSQLLRTYKKIGLVNEVFRSNHEARHKSIMKQHAGISGIGHTRYATFGANDVNYAQPFERKEARKWKWFSFGFNGNIANYFELRNELQEKNFHFELESDTEVVMHYLAYGLQGQAKPSIPSIFEHLGKRFDGAYNIVFQNADGDIVAARDPRGIKPLCYGENDELIAIASESAALTNIGIDTVHPVKPGSLIHISQTGEIAKHQFAPAQNPAHCMFEWVYFANVASVLDDKSVYRVRYRLGKELAKRETENITADHIVVPVPDTAKAAADAYAFELGVKVKEGLLRNRHLGRTFIEGTNRMAKARAKYSLNYEVLDGKKVLLVEDSVVRGTTTKSLIQYIKEKANAEEVHVRVSCPPIMFPCFYGIDMSTVTELIAARQSEQLRPGVYEPSEKTLHNIAQEIGADSIIYQSVEGLEKSIGFGSEQSKICTGCLTGKYATAKGNELVQKSIENAQKGILARTYE